MEALLRDEPRRESQGLANIELAVVAAEDGRYFRHRGVDWLSIGRALWAWLTGSKLSGASTIEQQLVRTIRGRYEITIARKASEIFLARGIARRFSKADCLWAYMLVAYFGWRSTGIKQVTRRLGVALSTCSEEDAAQIAAMLKVPMPERPSARYRERLSVRKAYVIRRMREWRTKRSR
ncbi:MAG: biosynthetic peptidoglycan transglycosylase [Devosia sp.]